MSKNSYVKPKKVSIGGERQVSEIIKLLLLWPQAKTKVIEEFIKDTLGITVTRVCLQEAKETLGLKKAEHSEKTLGKKHYAEMILLKIVEHHGLVGMSEQQYINKVRHSLKERFSEDTNSRLIEKWVGDELERLTKGSDDLNSLKTLIETSKEELRSLGVLPKEDTRQTQLI